MMRIDLKKHRTICLAAMVVFLPASAAVWALANDSLALVVAVVLGILGVIAAITEESLTTASVGKLESLEVLVGKQNETLGILNETVRENDRIIDLLEDRNSALSAELVAVSSHSDAANKESQAA